MTALIDPMSLFSIDLELELKNALERVFTLNGEKTPPNLEESIRYSLLAPGKRIRPRLALASAAMLGLKREAALPPALAIEMIHCFTLIHDDLPCMDDDDFRRGKPSNHKVYGEGIALLAGDALVPLALEVFFEAFPHVERAPFAAAMGRFLQAIGPRGVIGGQAEESLLTPESTLEQLTRMHALKTGALFEAPLLIPKDLAGITDDSAEGITLSAFAKELGLAFQIADDLEDKAEEAVTPTSVLFYLPEDEIRRMTIQRLEMASQGLSSVWKGAAQSLTAIAAEVVEKIRRTEAQK